VTSIGERWFKAYCLVEMGNVARARGELDKAREYYLQSYELREEFQDPEGMATALTYLGDLAVQQGQHAEASKYYDEALILYHDIHDKGGLAAALAGAARAVVALGQYDHARKHIREGMELAAAIKHVPQVLALIADLGFVQLADADEAGALELLTLAHNHPNTDHATRSSTQGSGLKLPAGYDTAAASAVVVSALGLECDFGIAELLDAAASGGATAPAAAVDVFPDGLTEREVEVLRLLAAGRSNQQIAEALFISTNTVANHVKNILSKTQTANRTEAAAYATAHGLI
jgi:DNA-binding NarL/FixJ family response regulator